MATTQFFNSYTRDLHEGNIDWVNDSLAIWLFAAPNTVTVADAYVDIFAFRVTANLSASPSLNGTVSKGTIGTTNGNDFNVDLNDTTIEADGGSIAFDQSVLITGNNIPICLWNWGGQQVITDGGTATFAYDAQGLFTVTVP